METAASNGNNVSKPVRSRRLVVQRSAISRRKKTPVPKNARVRVNTRRDTDRRPKRSTKSGIRGAKRGGTCARKTSPPASVKTRQRGKISSRLAPSKLALKRGQKGMPAKTLTKAKKVPSKLSSSRAALKSTTSSLARKKTTKITTTRKAAARARGFGKARLRDTMSRGKRRGLMAKVQPVSSRASDSKSVRSQPQTTKSKEEALLLAINSVETTRNRQGTRIMFPSCKSYLEQKQR